MKNLEDVVRCEIRTSSRIISALDMKIALRIEMHSHWHFASRLVMLVA
jgi:hypothetical protein